MASGLFFNPLVVLRAAPLVSSTCTLLFAWDQYFFLGIMNRPENRKHSRVLLPSYFGYFFPRGTAMVLAFVTTTVSTSVANLYTQRAVLEARESFGWYAAGAALAFAHLLFVPAIAPSCQALIDTSTPADGDSNSSLDKWLSVNKLRMWTVDLAAWIAVAFAVVKTLQV